MLIDCPKCGNKGLPSVYLPMCTACANIERRKSGEIRDDNATQQSVQVDDACTHPETFYYGDGMDMCCACGEAIPHVGRLP